MAEPKNLTDCYWYLQNQCIKGEACEYRHNESALTNTTVCKFWLEGNCPNDENCKFRHPSGVHTTKDTRVCFFFTQGKCTKGDSCPFLHTLTTETIPPPTKDPALEKKKKQEEEELRKLQAETKKEEERLAQLKAEREKLERINKRKNEQKNTQETGRKVTSAGVGTFVKSYDEIIKERKKEKIQADINKQKVSPTQKKAKMEELNNMETGAKMKKADKPIKKTEKPIKNTEKPVKNSEKSVKKVAQKYKPQKTETPTPSGPITFGIKTLDQIMKEKEVTNNGEEVSTNSKDEMTSTQKVTPATPSYLEDLRMKNQQKFGLSSVFTKNEQTSTNVDLSPKRKLTEEPKVVQQTEAKRPKAEQSKVPVTLQKAAASPPATTPKVAIKKSASVSDLDDFDKELADLGMEISSTTTNASSVDVEGDEFDKEFNELENLMST